MVSGGMGSGHAGSGDGGSDGAGRARGSDTSRAWEVLERAVIGRAVDLLSGPAGLASFLRRRQLAARLAGPSLPLDIGYAEAIPAGIRNAVILRDKHCRWPGGCDQPPAACDVHHVRHKANGGRTSTGNCVLLCFFHHQVAIHRWGWTLVLKQTGRPRPGTRTRRRCCTVTDHLPGRGNRPWALRLGYVRHMRTPLCHPTGSRA
jgi:HNH endonuclease